MCGYRKDGKSLRVPTDTTTAEPVTVSAGEPGPTLAVELSNLSKRYGDVEAAKGVAFDVGPGEIFALLGPNGAGKSTTIETLRTLALPSSGTAKVGGFDVRRQPKAVPRRIGLVFQEQTLEDVFLHFTGRQILEDHGERVVPMAVRARAGRH